MVTMIWILLSMAAIGGGEVADHPVASAVDAYLTELTEKEGFTGAVRLEGAGETILAKGYGFTDLSRRAPVTTKTLFYTASIGKGFTGAAILDLQEAGLLSVDDPLGKYFPRIAEAFRGITLHELLTHTAGLRENYRADGANTRNAAVRAVTSGPQNLTTGTFHYTNDAYALLAAVIEEVARMPFESYIEAAFLRPAGIRDTRFWGHLDDRDILNVAQKQRRLPRTVRNHNWGYVGSGGIYSNVDDLTKWFYALEDSKLLRASSRDALWRDHLDRENKTGIGYGWFDTELEDGSRLIWSRGTEDFGHNGLIQWHPPTRLLIVVLASSGSIDDVPAARLIGAELTRMFL